MTVRPRRTARRPPRRSYAPVGLLVLALAPGCSDSDGDGGDEIGDATDESGSTSDESGTDEAETDASTETDTDTDTGEPGEIGDALRPLGEIKAEEGNILHILDMQAVGDFLYMVGYTGMYSLDVSDPANPVKVDERMAQGLYWIDADADSLLVESRTMGAIRTDLDAGGQFDIQAMLPADGLSLEGGALLGDYAYIAGQDDGLLVRDRADLSPAGASSEPTNAFDVAVGGDHLFVADRDRGLMSFALDDPSAPTLVGELELGAALQAIVFQDDVVYAAASGSVYAIDVADPSAPAILDEVHVDGVAARVDVDGPYLAVATWNDTRLYDASDPAALELIALEDATDASMSLDLVGDVLYVGDWDIMRSYAVDPSLVSAELTMTGSATIIGDGDTGAVGVVLKNEGPIDLDVSGIDCTDGAVSVDETAFTIPPGGSQVVTVTAELASAGPQTTCTVTSDDVDEPAASLQILVNPEGLKVGDQAPDWSVPDLEGLVYNLHDFQGQVLLITIFSSL